MRGPSLRAIALLLGSLAACRPAGGSSAPAVLVDDAGVRLRLSAAPRRIVSLNPTTTELLFAIGAGPRLVGRSAACDEPAAATAVPSLGDGFPPAVEPVAAARPDLVVLWATFRAIREGRVLRLTESSANRPSPRAPEAVRALRARLISLTAPTAQTPSGDPR